MRKHIKYLISFLLIFGLTVNQCAIYSQSNSSNYYQVSQVDSRKERSHTYSELYVYGREFLRERIYVRLLSFLKLRDVHSTKITEIFNLQTERYLKISSIIAGYIFLNKKFVSSNQYPSLYIA